MEVLFGVFIAIIYLMPVFAVLLLLGALAATVFKLRSPMFRRKIWVTAIVVTLYGAWVAWSATDRHAKRMARLEKDEAYLKMRERMKRENQ